LEGIFGIQPVEVFTERQGERESFNDKNVNNYLIESNLNITSGLRYRNFE